jgi:NAD(P)-dependent dehydrogenase (short-subunit alcohol dehydrogenase family)
MQIAGKTFLITGGGSGLGAATARRLAGAGGQVLLADVNDAAAKSVAGQIGRTAGFARCDVTDPGSVAAAIEQAQRDFGPLWGAVNCAGISHVGRVLAKDGPHDLAAFQRVLNVNLSGTFNVIRLAAEAMSRHEPDDSGERGAIVNTASCAAFDGQIGQAAYSASKAGVAGMVLPIARELARIGVRVAAIAPGIFDTPMLAGLPPAAQQSLAAQVPFPPRLGRPEEYAALAQHIFENAMLNGVTIRLDGALRMGPK